MFRSEWKKGNIALIHRKGDKQNIKNCRPVSLLPMCGKIFERLISFQPGDSCINQLLSITHEIFTSFDNGLEVRSAVLDISKVFDKAWHEGLIFKLKQNTISGELLHILSDFLSNRKQRVVLNGQNSS